MLQWRSLNLNGETVEQAFGRLPQEHPMPKVKAKVGIQGNGWAIDAGEIQEWGEDRAALFLRSGDVELVDGPKVEVSAEKVAAKKTAARKK